MCIVHTLYPYLKDSVSDVIIKYFGQWCTTSGPRTISGPRRVVMWPAIPTGRAKFQETALILAVSTHPSFHKVWTILTWKPKAITNSVINLANHVSVFKTKLKLFQYQTGSERFSSQCCAQSRASIQSYSNYGGLDTLVQLSFEDSELYRQQMQVFEGPPAVADAVK